MGQNSLTCMSENAQESFSCKRKTTNKIEINLSRIDSQDMLEDIGEVFESMSEISHDDDSINMNNTHRSFSSDYEFSVGEKIDQNMYVLSISFILIFFLHITLFKFFSLFFS